MNMINVTLVGNLVKAPEQTCFPSGHIKTTLCIAVNSPRFSKAAETPTSPDYYRVELWGKLAEVAAQFLKKGAQVGVSGRLIMERWKDREGQEHMTPVVSATQLQFPPRAGSAAPSQPAFRSAEQPQPPPQVFQPPAPQDEEDGEDMESYRSDAVHASEIFEAARVLSIREPSGAYSPFRARRRA